MSVVVLELPRSNVSLVNVLQLIKDSFEERRRQGIIFSCSEYSLDDLKSKTGDGKVLVALDQDSNELLGTVTMFVRHDIYGRLYCSNELLAVAEKVKRQGIASMLLQEEINIAKSLGCECIISDTSVNAKSSIYWHEKNGFRKIGIESYKTTKYWSYTFRLQLDKKSKWNSPFYCKIRLILSVILKLLTKTKDGNYTYIGKILYR